MRQLLCSMCSLLLMIGTVHAQKSVFDETVREKDNLEPAIPRPEQEKIADAKLKKLEMQGSNPRRPGRD